MQRQELEDETTLAEEALEPEVRAPELAAMHLTRLDRRLPAYEEDFVPAGSEAPEHHFADEEFEQEPPRRPTREHEPDLEEILHEQHYL